jgi:rubrerythrin
MKKINKHFSKEIIDLGDSFAVTIPFRIMKDLELKKGDLCEFQISKLEDTQVYKCQACSYIFVNERDEVEQLGCPACDCSRVVEVKE